MIVLFDDTSIKFCMQLEYDLRKKIAIGTSQIFSVNKNIVILINENNLITIV